MDKKLYRLCPHFDFYGRYMSGITGDGCRLNEGEVLQFRMPSLRTVVTYPAYVNYYFVRGAYSAAEKSEGDGRYCQPERFADWFAKSGGADRFARFLIGRGESLDSFLYDLPANADIDSSLEYYGVIVRRENKLDASSGRYSMRPLSEIKRDSDVDSCKFECVSYSDGAGAENGRWTYSALADTADASSSAGSATRRLTQKLCYTLDLFVKGCAGASDGLGKGLCKEVAIGSYRGQYGECIDRYGNRYSPISGNTSNMFLAGSDSQSPYVLTALGTDPLDGRSGIVVPANSAYQLGPDDFLYVEYTPSANSAADQTDASGSPKAATPVGVIYKSGDIIQPNFDLAPSAAVRSSGKNFTKTDIGGVFPGAGFEGMYSLGANEQIEIKKPNSVNYASGQYYIYWTLKNKRIVFDAVAGKGSDDDYTYILGEDEYLYVTDDAKTGMSYYGQNTEISLTGMHFAEGADDGMISAEAVMQNGIAAIPWIAVSMSGAVSIFVTEYQTFNLTKGDELVGCEYDETDARWANADVSSGPAIGKQFPWRSCRNVVYRQSGSSTTDTLSEVSSGLDEDSESSYRLQGWEMRPMLFLEFGPDKSQVLHELDSIDLMIGESEETAQYSVRLQPQSAAEPMSIRGNYDVRCYSGDCDVSVSGVDSIGNATEFADFKLKVSKQTDVTAVVPASYAPAGDIKGFASGTAYFSLTPDGKYVRADAFGPDTDYYRKNGDGTYGKADSFEAGEDYYVRLDDGDYFAVGSVFDPEKGYYVQDGGQSTALGNGDEESMSVNFVSGQERVVRLNFSIPENEWALLPVYLRSVDAKAEDAASDIEVSAEYAQGENAQPLGMFNNSACYVACDGSLKSLAWWQEDGAGRHLRSGFNELLIPSGVVSVAFKATASTASKFDSMAVYRMTLIKADADGFGWINSARVPYLPVAGEKAEKALLTDLAGYSGCDEFCPTLPVEERDRFDFKVYDDSELAGTVLDPHSAFDQNNVAAGFTVCELDPSSFGNIKIARSSKRQ